MAWTSSDLEAVEAAIRARVNGGAVQSYSVAGRNLTYMTLEELRTLRHEMRREIESANRGGFPGTYIVPERTR